MINSPTENDTYRSSTQKSKKFKAKTYKVQTSEHTNVKNHKKTVSVKFNRVNILGLCETKSTMAS